MPTPPKPETNEGQTAQAVDSATPLFAPWWAVNVPESENDHTCTRCGHAVHLEHGSEWLGPDDNYHWNLCNSCAHELIIEMWMKLQDAMADTQRMDRLESDLLTITNQAVTASVDMSGKPWRAQFHGERKGTRFLTIRAAADSAMRANDEMRDAMGEKKHE